MRDEEHGSVFLEALISAAIVAMVVGALYQVIGGSAAAHRQVEARRAALMIAQSQLAGVGSVIPVTAGATDGAQDGYLWRVDISPYRANLATSAAGDLYAVTVAVRARADPGPPLAVLNSLRLGRG